MAGTVCSNCNVGWEIFAHERHCGYCGCATFDFSVRWQEEPLFYSPIKNDTATREVTLLVENTGSCPMTFQPIQTKHQLVDAAYAQPFKVNAGQSAAIAIRVDAGKLTLQPEDIRVRVQEAFSNLEEKSVPLRALPEPAFKLLPNPSVARYRKGTETMDIELRVEVTRSQFDISRVQFSPGKIESVRFMKGRYKEGDAAKRLRLVVDCRKLRDGVNEENLDFELRGLAELITQTVRIQAEVEPEPPKLFVPKAMLEITQERERTHTLTLQNQGESLLKIQEIDIEGQPGLVSLPDVKYPIEIEGGRHKNVEVSICGVGIEPGAYPIEFTITSNCETSPRYRDKLLNVTVEKLEEYPQYVAIDFGTTNSCCAYIDVDTYEPRLIPLGGEAGSPEIMPSTIVYHSRPTNETSYSVGSAAENYRTSEIDGAYYIASVKRWLGYQWHRQFPRELELQPRDVAADILKHIITAAEAHLDTLITRCVATYPTMFTLQQREDLRLAFEKNGTTELILIDEASAASIGTVFQHREKPLRDNFKLMVYDFGGGTIDIVLSQVTNTGNEIQIEPLVRGGNPKYGGDDVTQAIVDFILDECGKQIRRVNPDTLFDIPYLKRRKIPQPSGEPAVDKATRENAFVYKTAEEMKRELSEKSEVTSRFLGHLQVKVGDNVSMLENLLRKQQTRAAPRIGNDGSTLETLTQPEMNVELSREQLQTLIQPDLNQTFVAIDEMLAECGSAPPDIVVLAGQSSKMPLVKEMMDAHFQEKYQTRVDIHLAEHPKACVVIGAAQFSLSQTMPGRGRIRPVNVERTRARLGVVKLSSGGKPVFDEIIPQGKLIPDESFETTDFPLPAGTTFVDVREHFGTAKDLGETSQVASYTLELPEDVPDAALRKARLKMAVKASGEIELIALVDGQEYPSTVQQVIPAFVDEI